MSGDRGQARSYHQPYIASATLTLQERGLSRELPRSGSKTNRLHLAKHSAGSGLAAGSRQIAGKRAPTPRR